MEYAANALPSIGRAMSSPAAIFPKPVKKLLTGRSNHFHRIGGFVHDAWCRELF
jgi:hypothetical protein